MSKRYKDGDKVIIRKDLQHGLYYGGIYVNKDMEKMGGMVMTVKDPWREGENFELYEDKDGYAWTSDMVLDCICDIETYKSQS